MPGALINPGAAVGNEFANWASLEPDNLFNQDYARFDGSNGKWFDIDSSTQQSYFLVEYNKATSAVIDFGASFSLTLQAGNDAPVLAAGTPTLSGINEDASSNGGQLISQIVTSGITDPDTGASIGGIAIVGLNAGNGTWQYRLNNTGDWQAMGALSASSSLLLLPTDAVRFVPDERNSTSASFTYRAWDQTSGAAGDKVSTATTGGSSAFSSASNNATITVSAVNDAPSWATSATIKLPSIARSDDTTAGNFTIIQVADLVDSAIDDPDLNASTGIAITEVSKTDTSGNALSGSDSGKWQYRTATNANTTLNWLDLPSVSDSNALLLSRAGELRYLPNTSAVDTLISSLSIRAWDTSSGSTGSTANVTTAGGTTAYSSSSRQASLKVNGVTLANNLTALAFTEGGTATVGSGVTLSSSGNLSAASVQIVKGLSEGDGLQLASSFSNGAISSQWDANSGVLSLSGTASISDYQAALQAVQFSSGDDPTALVASRTIGFFLGTSTTTEAYLNLTITATADKPVITPGSASTFREGQGPVAILPNLTISDADDTEILSATVTIASSRQTADLLALPGEISSRTGITASSYNSSTGVLTLSGRATVADYQAALRAVTFENTSTNPTNSGNSLTRGIQVSVTDANSDGLGGQITQSPSSGSITVTVDPLNAAPALSAGMSAAYSENGTAVALGSGVTITDADDINLSGATLEIISGYTAGDALALPSATATATGISGSWNANTRKLTLTGTRLLANYKTAIEAVTFSSTSNDPTANGTATSRQISIQLRDANRDGASTGQALSNSAGATITLTAAADAPVLQHGNTTTLSYTEAGAALAISPALTISDADDSQLQKATVQISSGLSDGDRLNYTASSGISGSYDQATGLLTFSGVASISDYESLLRSVTYSSSSSNPASIANRTFTWKVVDANSDGAGAQASTPVTDTVNVVSINQAPSLQIAPTALAYGENDPAAALAADLTLSDLDSTQLSGATITISAGYTAGDSLELPAAVATATGISATYTTTGSSAVLTLSGNASLTGYQKALRAVTFSSSSDTPTASSASRTISWQLTDADTNPASSAAVISSLTITAVNDKPQLGSFAAPVITTPEDNEVQITLADLIGTAGQATASDIDGTVTGLQIASLLSGFLRLGSSSTTATAYGAGSNDQITSTINAYWTPAANAKGSGASALQAFTALALDDGGATSISPQTVSVNVTPVADGAQITAVTLPADGTYKTGETLSFTLTLDQVVTVDSRNGLPSLPITLATGGTRQAHYSGGSGTTAIRFEITVVSGLEDRDGITLGSSLQLNGGTITNVEDGSTVNAVLSLPALPSTAGIRIDGINDAPLLLSPVVNTAYSENDPAVALNPQIALSDSDSTQLTGATVSISAGYTAGDTLALPATVATATGITASYATSSSSAVLTLSGNASLVDYQRALRAITFASSSDNPTASSAARTISWQITDQDLATPGSNASSGVVTSSLTITPVNDAPGFSAFSGVIATTNEDTEVQISLADLAARANATDVDDTVTAYVVQSLSSGSLRLGASAATATPFAAGSNALIDASTNAYWTPAIDANGTGSGGRPALEAFSLLARDGSGALSALPITATVAVTPVADAAVITAITAPTAGTYASGDTIAVEVRLDHAVTITASGALPFLVLPLAAGGTLQLRLSAPASTSSGSFSATVAAQAPLTFSALIPPGAQSPTTGLVFPAALTLPAGSSLNGSDDGSAIAANLTLPTALPTALPSLAGVLIDAVAPQLLSITAESSNQANAASQNLLLTFSKPVLGLDPTDLNLTSAASSGSGAAAPQGSISGLTPLNASSNGAASQFRLSIGGIQGTGTLTLALDAGTTAIQDEVGNELAASTSTGVSGSLSVDTDAPAAPALDAVGWDHCLNASETTDPAGVTLSGRSGGIEAGQIIQLAITTNTANTPVLTAQATVSADGSWSTTLPPAQLSGLSDGSYTLSTASSDAAGNAAAAASSTFRIDRTPATLSNPVGDAIGNPLLADASLNQAELTNATSITISGSSDAEDGQRLTLRLGNAFFSTTIANGAWQLDIPTDVFSGIDDGRLDLRLALTDLAGNPTTLDTSLQMDRTAAINLLPISGDGWINSSECTQPIAFDGLAEGVEDGRSLTLSLTPTANGSPTGPASTFSATVQSDAFAFSIANTALNLTDGSTYSVAVNGSDLAGNPVVSERSITVDLTPPTVDLQLSIGSDSALDLGSFSGTINALQLSNGVRISSAAASDASTTSITIGSNAATLVSPRDGSWSLTLDPDRLPLPNEGSITITAIVTDLAGNSTTETCNLNLDRSAVIEFGAAFDGNNNAINATEALSLNIAGSTRDVQNGAVVSLQLWDGNTALGNAYTATVTNNAWSLTGIDGTTWPDGTLQLRATVTDAAGNIATATQTFSKNTTNPRFPLLNMAGDNVINLSEANAPVAPSISGLINNAEDGCTVTITLPGAGTLSDRTLSTTVENGLWNLPIPADLLAVYGANNGTYNASISVTNQAGNTATTSHPFAVDTEPPAFTQTPLDATAWEDAALDPAAHPITLTGSVPANETNLRVTVVLNGTALQATVLGDSWSVQIPRKQLETLRATGNTLELSASDAAGNVTSLPLQMFDISSLVNTPPLINLPNNGSLSVDEGTLLIAQCKANRAVSWSLEGIDPTLLQINETTGSLSFVSPLEINDNLGDEQHVFTVVGTDIHGIEGRKQVNLLVRNITDPAPDRLDQDGINASLEDLASNGRGNTGDLNNDGIPDRDQSNVTAVPWISKENFQAAQANPSQAAPNSFASLQASSGVRITHVDVRKPGDLAVAGNSSSAVPAQINSPIVRGGLAAVSYPYDPLVFRLESIDTTSGERLTAFVDLAPPLSDGSDPYPGTQVRQIIELPGDGLLINAYLKWNPSANDGAGSWYDFRADGNLDTFDNGAELIDLNADGRIDRILLTYTDGNPAGGDIDGLENGIINDPGMPGLLSSSLTPLVWLSNGTTTNATQPQPLPASSLSLDSQTLLTNQAISLNNNSLDIDLLLGNISPQTTNASFDLALINDPLSLIDNQGTRRAKTYLVVYAVNASGELIPASFDPRRRRGARLYDTTGDGVADLASVALSDGSSIDTNSATNAITTQIVAGTVELTPSLSQTGKLVTAADPANKTPAILNLKANLSSRSKTANQIGYIVLNADELATINTLTANINDFKARAHILFSTLEMTDVTLPADSSFDRSLQLINGQSIQFFEIADGTLDDLADMNDPRLRMLDAGEVVGQTLRFTSLGGVIFTLSLLQGDPGLDALISQEQATAPLLDFSAFTTSQTVRGTLVLSREADYDAITGFYRTLDASGAVRASNGIDVLRPGDPNYATEALRADNRVQELSGLAVNDDQISSRLFNLQENTYLAPFAQVKGSTFFAYPLANPDRIGHLRLLGNNMFGLEDQLGGGDLDFDDQILGFKFTSVT